MHAKLLLFALLLSSFCYSAQELPPAVPSGNELVLLYAKSMDSQQPIAGKPVQYVFTSNNNQKVFASDVSDSDGRTTVYLDKGVWQVSAGIDDPATQGKDWASYAQLNIQGYSNGSLPFIEVGSVYGEVVDENGVPVKQADLRVECVKSPFPVPELNGLGSLNASQGSILIQAVPTGLCRISAQSGSATGFSEIELSRGELRHVRIKLGGNSMIAIAAAVGVLALLIIITVLLAPKAVARLRAVNLAEQKAQKEARKPKPREKESARVPESAPAPILLKTKRVMDVLNTLQPREREVVNLLLKHDGKLKQNRIRRELLIPKTSLTRMLSGLEARNIIELKEFGNTKFVSLSKWFKEL